LQRVSLDVYKYKQIPYLTVLDHYSEYPVAFQLQDNSMESVQAAVELFVSMFGVPRSFLTDQGNEFNSVHEVCKHITTAAYRPQGNGKLERLHKEIGKLCRIYSCDPLLALTYLRTHEMKLNFFSSMYQPTMQLSEQQQTFQIFQLKDMQLVIWYSGSISLGWEEKMKMFILVHML